MAHRSSLALAAALLAVLLHSAAADVFSQNRYSGDATYYGYRTRGFGHCSFHFHGFGDSAGYRGTPLAINAAQYTGTSICGLCVKYRGTGTGAGGNPVSSAWQSGFICDECPECKFGDLDQQMGGDGRWKVEWYPVQCPVGSSSFRYGFQGGNPWYKKMMVANARVPLRDVKIWVDGAWRPTIKTIDNYWEVHGDMGRFWTPCAKVQVTSILGDTVEDKVCCSSGTCTGGAQFPCRSSLPGDDCAGAPTQPSQVNVGGIGQASGGSSTSAEAGKNRFNRGADLAAARIAAPQLGLLNAQCGDKQGPWSTVRCAQGLVCKDAGKKDGKMECL